MMSVDYPAFPVYDGDAYARDVAEFDRLWARNTTPDEDCRMARLMARMACYESTVPTHGDVCSNRAVEAVS